MVDNKERGERGDSVLFTIFELVITEVSDVLDEEEATKLGRKVVDRVRHTFGGEQIYICQGRTLEAIISKNSIWSEFTGNNYLELAKKYGYAEQSIYRIVKMMRKLKMDEAQGDLFDASKGRGPKNKGPSLC
ncbi:transcriptional regulator [Pseudoalteromonas sp. JBTF-M23]|uniref:Transcriptional regulator n=1 Tax=Pseudoalteromonas caenipelagi TaxID=2726988 RepID=A0A849VHA0_9GAMM|nr:Mor transcription activator family protein [Pseudoalteromonas caenipelagi]NOU53139.1 transcriptional regulator [Pseudoalteromonas caenipelagi]